MKKNTGRLYKLCDDLGFWYWVLPGGVGGLILGFYVLIVTSTESEPFGLPGTHPYAIAEQHQSEFLARKDVYNLYCPTRTMRATPSCDKIFAWMIQATVGDKGFPFGDSNLLDTNKP